MKPLHIFLSMVLSYGAFFLVLAACAKKDRESAGSASAPTSAPARDPGKRLEVGSAAPDFTARDDRGETVRLADFRGRKNVVLVFYPHNNTPGCTRQLCAIRDDWSLFVENDVAVFGVNPAEAASHRKFAAKFEFPFPLLVDRDKELVRRYGCQGTLMPQRTVYGIDKSGVIVFAQRGSPTTRDILEAFSP